MASRRSLQFPLNYRGPLTDADVDPTRSELEYTPSPLREGQSLADELGVLAAEFESESESEKEKENEDEDEDESENERAARLEVDQAMARHDKFMRDNGVRDDLAGKAETPPREDADFSQRSQRVSHSSSRLLQTPPRLKQATLSQPASRRGIKPPASLDPQSLGERRSHVSSRRKTDRPRTIIVKPPPLSPGIIDTISREHGWSWLWFLVGTLIFIVVAIASGGDQPSAGRKPEVLEITKALEDVVSIMLDDDWSLRRLADSPFNSAALPFEELRKKVLQGEGGKGGEEREENFYQTISSTINTFIAKNRELDHAWRSFLEQQIEATAELSGILAGHAQNAGSTRGQTNWINAAHAIARENYSHLPHRIHKEGNLILCQLLPAGEGAPPSCPPGPTLLDASKALRKALNMQPFSTVEISGPIFSAYDATTADVARITKSIMGKWLTAMTKIEKAQGQFDEGDHGIGRPAEVAAELDDIAQTLDAALKGPLVARPAAPKFPAAIRRLAEARVGVQELGLWG
ncbi:hypothetical protein DSL72_002484 [Monilinia vaccinii-corymbosi]|uniref:Uncharacterized protein n=1 Tax=Monilinia vaccinii-corymbosi TaxID=61207 RepID=A0A8A3PCU9_9HELO|nr:hypothetical protein DSL72_002484 [Monilinia vaccinii-corymbosi]